MPKITIKKYKGEWVILKNKRKLDTEISKVKAQQAANFYRTYFRIPKNKRREWVRKGRS